MYAEFYNLKDDIGVSFPITGFHMCGDILEVTLSGELDPFFVRVNEERDYFMMGRFYTDFRVDTTPSFREISETEAREWLIPR